MDQRIEISKLSAVDGMEYFLRNFGHVPDERLHWSPTPTSKSPIRVAAHTALYASRFAKMIRDRRLPSPDQLDVWLADRNAEEEALTERHEMETTFRTGTAEVIEILDSLNPEDMEVIFDTGLGWSMPMTKMIALPGWHATLHGGQIDYLQTCWGDEQIYF
ncbi:MAG: DinB family protein [Fimbriimonadaceae bacterium]|nr:DinB family protein [Fimbriimonadaceae bacterium]